MLFGILSGILWALDTTILSIALSLAPFSDNTAQTIAFAAIVARCFVCFLDGPLYGIEREAQRNPFRC